MWGGIDIMAEDCGDGEAAGGEPDREPDPSDSLRSWGAVQQALREHAGYSRAEFADLVRFSKHTVESVELGRRMPDESYVVRSEELLGNTGALRKSSSWKTSWSGGWSGNGCCSSDRRRRSASSSKSTSSGGASGTGS